MTPDDDELAARRAALAQRNVCSVRTGDTVLHRPSGETWLVACVRGDCLAWCGWPEGEARLADCELLSSATDTQHWEWVERIAKSAGGFRARYCQTLIDALQYVAAHQAMCPMCGAPMPGGTPASDGAAPDVWGPLPPFDGTQERSCEPAEPSGWRDRPPLL